MVFIRRSLFRLNPDLLSIAYQSFTILTGHQNWVDSCAFSPDGGRVASTGSDSTVKIWDSFRGECLASMTGHEASVLSCAFSPDGQRVVSASDDHTVRFWCAETFAQLMPVIQAGRFDWAVIAYQALDADGRINCFPVEIEGPLPIKEF